MDLRIITKDQKKLYNNIVTHVIQSWEWGEFRQSLGLPLSRYGIFNKGKLTKAFQISFHKIPFTKYFVGYLPKGPTPDKELAEALNIIGQKHHCAFIKIEPDIVKNSKPFLIYPKFFSSPKPLFTKYNLVLDLTKSEETLFKNLHPKARYNIRLAQKKGVWIEQRSDNQAFEIYINLYFETTKRQGFFGHNLNYHQKVWQTLKDAGLGHLLIAFYKTPDGKTYPLSAWMLVKFKDTLYYPYGGSSTLFREVMANNLIAWEAIKLGKQLKLKSFDMWGSLGPNPNPKDPYFGFHDFKRKYGAQLIEYIGTYDYVFNNILYFAFTTIDKMTSIKVMLLKLLSR